MIPKPASDDSQDGRIDELCDEFERQWQAGARPEIGFFLDQVSADARSHLLRELVAVEVELRVQKGETPRLDDYVPRFSDEPSAIADLFPSTEEGTIRATLRAEEQSSASKQRASRSAPSLTEARTATEPQLLFAVLAYESELIDLVQLTAACRAWAADKCKPLAELLVARGWLSDRDREFVESLVERKLAKHQHDPRVTLNSVVRGEVCDAIKEVDDSDIQQSLSSWPSSGPVLIETISETQIESEQPKSRYTWISEVDTGGLGRVWLARDNDLAREVALKEIRPDKSTASAVRRLIKEAQITGQLQHPNIVPVYEVNRGGRPFYTMKLVKGETLSKAIRRHHEQRRAGPADPLSLPRLLNVFANVCEALAYAHSRGIIHRDLKPENIVLGDYGEAIVLDWGLAKQVGSAEEAIVPVVVTEDAQSPATHLGATPGTPAYMSPEQAAGRVDLIDHRTDVYGLGAILFEILTGHAPHRSPVADATRVGHESLTALLHRIATAETPRARASDLNIPLELDAVCAKAMSKHRDNRYPDAKSLVADVRRFLSDEPVSVLREPVVRRAGRWMRQHQTAATTIAATLLIAFVGIAWSLHYRNEVRIKASKGALQISDEAVNTLRETLFDDPFRSERRPQMLKRIANANRVFMEDKSRDLALRLGWSESQMRLCDLYELLGQVPDAIEELGKLETWFSGLVTSAKENLQLNLLMAECHPRFGRVLTLDERESEAERQFQLAFASLDRIPKPDSTECVETRIQCLVERGRMWMRFNHVPEAGRDFDEAARFFESMTPSGQPADSSKSWVTIRSEQGQNLIQLGRAEEAVSALAEASKVFDNLINKHTERESDLIHSRATNQIRLGIALKNLGRDQERIKAYKAAAEDLESLLIDFPRATPVLQNFVTARLNLAIFLHRLNLNVEAHEHAAIAMDVAHELGKSLGSESREFQFLGAVCETVLGQILDSEGDTEHAEQAFTQAIKILSPPDGIGSFVSQAAHRLAIAKRQFGRHLQKAQQNEKAEAAYEAAIRLFGKLQAQRPDDADLLDDLAWTHTFFADLLRETGDTDRAAVHSQEAIRLRRKWSAPEQRHLLALLLADASGLRNIENVPVRSTLEEAIQEMKKAVAAVPENHRYWTSLGLLQFRASKLDEAKEAIDKAIALDSPDKSIQDSRPWLIRAMLLKRQGDNDGALDAFDRAAARPFASANRGDLEFVRLRNEASQLLGIPLDRGESSEPSDVTGPTNDLRR